LRVIGFLKQRWDDAVEALGKEGFHASKQHQAKLAIGLSDQMDRCCTELHSLDGGLSGVSRTAGQGARRDSAQDWHITKES